MSSFFSLKNKLGLISLITLALNFAIPHVQAKSTEEALPKAEYDYSSSVDFLFLSIHKITPDILYIEMVQQLNPQMEKDNEKFKISLSTSREAVKKETIRRLRSSLAPCPIDLLPE